MNHIPMKKKVSAGLAVMLVLLSAAYGGYYFLVERPNLCVQDDGILYIHKGAAFEDVVAELVDRNYLLNESSFRKVASVKRYPERIRPGKYRVKDGMNNNDLVDMLRSGEQEAVDFTFNNIRSFSQFAGAVSRQLDIDSAAMLAKLEDSRTAEAWGFSKESFMCMFLPDTYQLYWTTGMDGLLERMHREYKNFWNGSRLKKAAETGLSPVEISILASIVGEETNCPEEYPVIAGVYINRLEKGWKLEACPTLKYAWGDFSIKRILDKHLSIDSPYNTYMYVGLPPGPVRMAPGKLIDAVLDHSRHRYMFFCARSDFSGRHHFSRSLGEHNRHAREYHQALNRKRIYR